MYRFALLFVFIFGVITQTNAAVSQDLNELQSNVNLFITLFGSSLGSNFSVPKSGVDECALKTDKCLGNCSNGDAPDPGYTCANGVQVDASAILAYEIISYAFAGGISPAFSLPNLTTINNVTYDVSANSVTYVYGLTAPLGILQKAALAAAPGAISSATNNQLSGTRVSITSSDGDKVISVKFIVPETVTVACVATGAGSNETLREAVYDIIGLNSSAASNAAAFISAALPSDSSDAITVVFLEPASAAPKTTTVHKTRACTFYNSLNNETGSTIMADAGFTVKQDSITTTDSGCALAGAAPVNVPSPAPQVSDVPAPVTPTTPAPSTPNAPASPITSGATSLAFGFAVLIACLLF